MRHVTHMLDLIADACLRFAMLTSCTCCGWANNVLWRRMTLRRLSQRQRE